MKNVLIVGASCVDIAAYVDEFPKSDEDLNPNHTVMRVSGDGFVASSVFQLLHMPNILVSSIGSGVYADAVKDVLKQFDLKPIGTSEKIAGCSYTVIDHRGLISSMRVPGGEMDFDASALDKIDVEDCSYLYFTDEMLESEFASEFVDFALSFKGNLFFDAGVSNLLAIESYLEDLFAKHPFVHIEEAELAYLSEGIDDLVEATTSLQKRIGGPLLVHLHDGSSIYKDNETMITVPYTYENIVDMSGVKQAHGAAFLAAHNAGVSLQSSIEFANEYAGKVVQLEDANLPMSYQEEQRFALKDIILKG